MYSKKSSNIVSTNLNAASTTTTPSSSSTTGGHHHHPRPTSIHTDIQSLSTAWRPAPRRPQRRLAAELEDCSRKSVAAAMSRFVRSVGSMNSAVLLPSKLQDLQLEGGQGPGGRTNPQSLHAMLNQMKEELVSGRGERRSSSASLTSASPAATIATVTSTVTSSPAASPAFTGKKLPGGGGGGDTPETDEGFSSLNSFSRSTSDDDASSDTDSFLKGIPSSSSSYSASSTSGATSSSSTTTSTSNSTIPTTTSCSSSKNCSSSTSSSVGDGSGSEAPSDAQNGEESSEAECMMNVFRHHLEGLQTTLHRFSEYAELVSSSYQAQDGCQ